MTRDKIFNKVASIISDQFGLDRFDVEEDMSLSYDLNADETDLDDLALAIEEEFGLDIYDDIESIKTVGKLVDYIEDNIY